MSGVYVVGRDILVDCQRLDNSLYLESMQSSKDGHCVTGWET